MVKKKHRMMINLVMMGANELDNFDAAAITRGNWGHVVLQFFIFLFNICQFLTDFLNLIPYFFLS